LPEHESRLDLALTIILAITIVVAMSALVYVIVTPKIGERFTEFYLLGPGGIADEYPSDLVVNETGQLIVGVVNHEYETVNYTVEVWLVNQTSLVDNETNETVVSYHGFWFFDRLEAMLNHTPINIEEPWMPQWEVNYSFSVDRPGQFKLAFLLFRNETERYERDQNYASIAEEKLESAYRETHLWLTVV
jgi:uncharacterized membrane protein